MTHHENHDNLRSHPAKIIVIIPAFNEENGVVKVIHDLPREYVSDIIVANNNSRDTTRKQALEAGAIVVDETRQGYGAACLKGMEYIRVHHMNPDIVVFLDADYSDHPDELPLLVGPIIHEGYDMVIGSRALGKRERRSMAVQQLFGNWLATRLILLLHGVRYTDLGPFRAITWKALQELNMQDQNYGWTVEMQLKAAKAGLRITEVPVSYRERIGFSKVSGTLKGTVLAGYKIITTIFKYRL